MAADTVVVHNISTLFVDKNNLRFFAKRENGSMPHSVFCFEIEFVEHVVVWNMTIVAIGYPAVRTVVPGGILRCHNVAVGAGFRIVGQIRIRFRNIKYKK